MELSREERKEKGIFYTPTFIADYMARKAVQYANGTSTILDPSCGDGELLAAISRYIGKESHLFGIDCERTAINAANSREYNCPFLGIRADSIKPYNARDRKHGWERLFKTCGVTKGFDVIISNPPWGSDLSSYDKNWFREQYYCGIGQFNSYDLFLELILDLLSVGGIYSIIIPGTIYSQEHTRIRQLLLEQTSIYLIARLGEGIFPGVNIETTIFCGRKDDCAKNNSVKCYNINKEQKKRVISGETALDEIERCNSIFIPQKRFLSNKDFGLDINLSNNDGVTMNKFATGHSLGEWATIDRGAEISKKGTINLCRDCNKWFAVPRKLTYTCPHCGAKGNASSLERNVTVHDNMLKNDYPLLTGSDIFRFSSKNKKWISIGYEGIKYKNDSLYKTPKILIRKTGVGITSCIDNTGAITVQCIYIIRVKELFRNFIPLELLNIIINSRAITFYLLKKYGDTEWKSHPYLTQAMISIIPMPQIDNNNSELMERIKYCSSLLAEFLNKPSNKSINKSIDLTFERLVADLFGLTVNDYKLIMNTISNADQLIPIKRLNNCSPEEIFQDGI